MEKAQHIVILAAGDFPTHPVPLAALRGADFVVCCDSAYATLAEREPQWAGRAVVVGDGDSLPEAVRRSLADRWVHVAEQDYNDLHKAMAWATGRFSIRHAQFTILGATGRREDHMLGNVAYLATFAAEYPGIGLRMLTDHGTFTHVRGSRTFSSFERQQVSIFSLTPDEPVSVCGLQYPISGRCLRLWWEGTLNAALADTFSVSGGSLLVFQTHEAKPL